MIKAFVTWLAHTAFSGLIQKVTWIIPLVQSFHILCIAVVMTSVLMLDLRLLGVVGRSVPIAGAERRFLPPVWIALLGLLLSGSVLIAGEPARELLNDVFRLKMLLLVIVVGITLTLQARVRFEEGYWESSSRRRLIVKGLAMVSLILWCAILTCGRWIAYATDNMS